jgi:hypothetical protein
MAALWREMLCSSGHDTTREDESLLRAVQHLNPRRGAAGAGEDPQETGSRMDITAEHSTTAARYAYDISISHVATPEQLDATKRNTYLQMCQAVGVQLVPVVFSTHGAWSRGVADDLKRIARMKEMMDGQIPASIFKHHWSQVIAIHLARVTARSMNSAIISLRKDSDLQRGRVFAAALEDYMINERRSGRYEV